MNLSIENVSKRYGKLMAVKEVNLQIGHGVTGFLGPNGAGKTTLLQIVATLIKPDKGRVNWCGLDIREYGLEFRRVLGYLPQAFGYYPNFTVSQFLLYIGALKEIDKRALNRMIPEVLAQVGLSDAEDKKLKHLSGGMRQRVGIAQAMLNDPQVLIVDEPSAGLDPEERMRFRNLLTDVAGDRIVLLSTHIVSDLEAVAGTIVMLQNGTVIVHAAPAEILADAKGKVWELTVDREEAEVVKHQFLVSTVSIKREQYLLRVIWPERPLPQAIEVEPGLEDAYLLYQSKDERHGNWHNPLAGK